MQTQIAQPSFVDPKFYKPSAFDITFERQGLNRHTDIREQVLALAFELKQREIVDKAEHVNMLETTHDELVDAARAAQERVAEAKRNHFDCARSYANCETVLTNRNTQRNTLLDTINNRNGGLRKRAEIAEDEKQLQKLTQLVDSAQSMLSQQFTQLQYAIAAVHQAEAEWKTTFDAAKDAQAAIDMSNGVHGQYASQSGLSMGR